MGAGLSAQAKVRELQKLPQKEAMSYLQEAGVPKAEAKIVTKRVREMQMVDAVAVAMLVDGLSGEAQDALAAMAQGSGLPGSIAHNESLEDEIDKLLLQGWSEPPASLDDGPSLVGYTIWVAGHGKGRVTEFVRARMGPSSHVVDFQNPVEGAARISRTIKLRRKGNSEALWLVQLPTTVVVGEDDAERAAAARDARLSLLGGRQSRTTGPVGPIEPEPEPEQMRPVTPPWAQWWKANGPGNGQQRNLTQQQRLNQRRQHHEVQHGAPQMPTGQRYSNGLTAGGKQRQTGQRRRPIPTASPASSSLPPWDLEPVSTGTATAAAFAAACASKGESGGQDNAEAMEIGESLDGVFSNSSQAHGQESVFSASLQQFLDEEAPPSMPPPSREQELTFSKQGGLPTVSSVSSDCDAVEFATFGSTPSEWTPREGGDRASASIEEDLDEADLSFDMPDQQVLNGGLGLGLSGSRGALRMGAPGESAKIIADKAYQGVGDRGLGQHALPKPQQGGNGATVKAGRWKKGQLLGTGSFGQVYQGLNLDTGAMLAVKVLTVPGSGIQDTLEEIHQEIELMSSLSHANIVQYLGAEVDVRARELFIFQEWVPGGSLSAVLEQFGGQFEPPLIRRYLVHLLGGLEYLHEHMIVHRDIKGDNVLVSEDGTAKLADFGASKRLGPDGTVCESHHSLKGTPYFMAPEQMLQENVGRKSDIWALGGVALLMATGQPPWAVCKVANPYALFLKVYESKSPPPMDKAALDPQLYSLLVDCFTREPENRPSAAQLKNHSFVQQGP